jgi:hypothetical protein
MNGEIMMKRRANKTEQKNRVKTASGDFSIIDRKKKKIEKRKNMEVGEERRRKTHFTTFASLE